MATQKVSIRYLIDVAIGNPEPGIVNFNALYTVLQAISEKLSLQDENIEIDSSFCPISTTIFESKSNVSSEKLVEHQVFDFNSDPNIDKMCQNKPKESPKDGADMVCHRAEHNTPHEQDDRKVGFDTIEYDQKRSKESERLTNYRSELKQHIDALNARLGKIENIFAATVQVEHNVECVRKTVDLFHSKLDAVQREIAQLKEMRSKHDQDISACRKKLEHDHLARNLEDLRMDFEEFKETAAKSNLKDKRSKPTSIPQCENTNDMKIDFSKLQDQIFELRANICSLTDDLKDVEKRLAQGMSGSSVLTMHTFDDQISSLRECVQNANTELSHLQEDHKSQNSLIEELTTKLEELTHTKIDKEEIDELLSEKADYTMLQRKVSVENMNADRRKLEKQITEITDCFVLNEEHVQKQIGDIKKFLGDQSLEDMLFDFKVKVDKDIQVVRDAIKKLAEMKPDVDAAAARLRDLQCLSCDQEVVMRAIEMNNLSKFGDAYVSKTISPNVTFEIGKLREAGKIGPQMDLSDALCDMAQNLRHSGGMHTIVTNKDRVTKMRRK